jgi:hypothetical protein
LLCGPAVILGQWLDTGGVAIARIVDMGAKRAKIHRIVRRRAEEMLRTVGGEIEREPAREIGGIKDCKTPILCAIS